MDTKKEIRNEYLNIRDNIESSDRSFLSERICRRLFTLNEVNEADAILTYVSYKSEVDTINIINRLIKMEKSVCVPRVLGDSMEFYVISSFDDLEIGYKGILEPKTTLKEYIPVGNEPILVPGCVFDRNLYRIGYGKGFYDKYLERFSSLYSIGLAYDCQVIDRIPVDEWDRGLDIILTEKEEIIL